MSEADYVGTLDTSGVGPGVWHHYQNITDVYDSVPAVQHQFPHVEYVPDAGTAPTAEDAPVDPLAEDEVIVPEPVVETPAPEVVPEVGEEATPEEAKVVEAAKKSPTTPRKRTARRN